jgi:hypothetical protein
MVEMRDAYRVWWETLMKETARCSWEGNVKMDLKKCDERTL